MFLTVYDCRSKSSLVEANFRLGAVAGLEAVAAEGVGEDDVDVEEPDPELELLRDVQVLVLEGALEAALGLARAGVVAAGEQELVEPE